MSTMKRLSESLWSMQAKEIIKKHSKDFGGSLTDIEVQKLANISRNTFYKYKKELKDNAQLDRLTAYTRLIGNK